MRLLDPLGLGPRTAPNRVLFGPHVTNLGDDDRRYTARHVAYYERRARGGCGTIVVEGASVHESDWPYERAPLAARAGDGMGGGRGRAAAATAPSSSPRSTTPAARARRRTARRRCGRRRGCPRWSTREVPKWMEPDDIAAVVAGFARGGRIARDGGCDGVEVNAGQHSLVRQFLSGLTNHRDDEWGADRLRFAREVIAAVRAAVGPARVVGLRLSCDELAPWAGITPEMAPGIAAALVADGRRLRRRRARRDLLGRADPPRLPPAGGRSTSSSPPPSPARSACRSSCRAPSSTSAQAEWVLARRRRPCAGVEMTRAQIADPDLVAKLRAGAPERIRPCTRCNQTCQVRDVRNPLVTCIGEPTLGARDGGSRLVRAGGDAADPSPSSAAVRPGWRRPGWPPSAGTR